MVEIRSKYKKGIKVFNIVKRPTVVYDKDGCILLKIGEFEEMEKYMEKAKTAYRGKRYDYMADNICLLELKPDQELVDKVFQCSGYLRTLVKCST